MYPTDIWFNSITLIALINSSTNFFCSSLHTRFILPDKLIHYETECNKGIIINNQNADEDDDSRYLSGADNRVIPTKHLLSSVSNSLSIDISVSNTTPAPLKYHFDPDVDGVIAGYLICKFLSKHGKSYMWYINSNRSHDWPSWS